MSLADFFEALRFARLEEIGDTVVKEAIKRRDEVGTSNETR
jgi:hypothetical protein